MIKLCCCTDFREEHQLAVIKAAGFDAVEPALNLFAGQTEEQAKAWRKKLDGAGLSCASFNCMLPGSIRLLGQEHDTAALAAYLEKAFYFAALAGAPVVTMGSGGARNIPDGMSREAGETAFCEVLAKEIAPVAAKNGLRVGIEPLRDFETNFLNNCAEILKIVDTIDLPEIGLTVDQFQAHFGGENPEQMLKEPGRVFHCHTASVRRNRDYLTGEDAPETTEFFAALKKIGYSGAVSEESTLMRDYEESLRQAFAVMRAAR